MNRDQKITYKRNYIENAELEFVSKYGRCPAAATYTKWGKEADEKLAEMELNAKKWQK